jgi:hypothetical protein
VKGIQNLGRQDRTRAFVQFAKAIVQGAIDFVIWFSDENWMNRQVFLKVACGTPTSLAFPARFTSNPSHFLPSSPSTTQHLRPCRPDQLLGGSGACRR